MSPVQFRLLSAQNLFNLAHLGGDDDAMETVITALSFPLNFIINFNRRVCVISHIILLLNKWSPGVYWQSADLSLSLH